MSGHQMSVFQILGTLDNLFFELTSDISLTFAAACKIFILVKIMITTVPWVLYILKQASEFSIIFPAKLLTFVVFSVYLLF